MPIFAQRWFDGDSTEAKRRTALGGGPEWQGVLREKGSFHEEGLARIPEHLSFEEAATLPCAALTAWNALILSGKLKAGETVLTLGTGGVSLFAIQFAKMFGSRVISTSSSDEKILKLKDLGVDETINYREFEDWDKKVLELTAKKGVNHVIEVGGAGTVARSIASAKFAGHVALIGALSGGPGIDPVSIFMKSVRVQGIFTGSRTLFEEMLRAVEYNKLRPVIDRTFGFDEAREAFEHMKSGAHFGKIVISY
jgi:NADPH:quinone reductase-like Zn-dependent oxidoreductase